MYHIETFDIAEELTPYVFKIVLLGDGGVGKTSIRRRFMGEGFFKNHLMTIGADFAEKTITIRQRPIKFQIWDIAGQSQFKRIRHRFLMNASAAIIVFDITECHSFENLQPWLEELWKINKRSNIPIIIVGNKSDLHVDRVVLKDDVEQFLIDLQTEQLKNQFLKYIETSAKTGENIDKLFHSLGYYLASLQKHRSKI